MRTLSIIQIDRSNEDPCLCSVMLGPKEITKFPPKLTNDQASYHHFVFIMILELELSNELKLRLNCESR